MAKTIYIDVATGEARTSLNGTVYQRLKLFLRDLTPLEIGFIKNGEIITDEILAADPGAAHLKVGIRAEAGQGDILALATVYTIVGDVARLILSLNTVALVDYFAALPANTVSQEFVLEVEVSNSSLTEIATYYQAPCVIAKEVNVSDDDPPVPAAEADDYVKISDLAGYAGATVLDELLDVDVPTPAGQELLSFNQSLGKWVNTPILDGGNF